VKVFDAPSKSALGQKLPREAARGAAALPLKVAATVAQRQDRKTNCFVHTQFNNRDYCVPEEAATTKRIFGLLGQLIFIQLGTGD
jgi:hypothetical protein